MRCNVANNERKIEEIMVNNPNIRFTGFSDEWEERKLGDLAKVQGGNAWSSSDYVENGQYLVITISNITGNEYVNDFSGNYIDCINPGIYELFENDILVSLTGNVGRVSKMTKTRAVLNQRVARVSTGDEVDDAFIFHILSKSEFEFQMMNVGQGAAQKNISNRDIINYDIKTPTLKEQQKIGSIFSTLDHKIGLEERQIELLKDLKKGYLQKMFPKNGATVPEWRFAGFAGDWEERKLGEVGKTKSGIGFPEALQGGTQGTPFYKVSDMNNPGNEVVMMNANNYASDSQLKENKWNPINPQNSGVVFAKVGAAIFLDRKRIVDTSFLIDNNMMSYLFDSSWNRYFGKTLFEKLRLSRFAQVGALPSFNGSDVEDIKVMIPEESEQKMIGNMFEKLDDTIALHQRKLDLLKDLKKGLSQQMFV
jgi:type I restriction enzyme S subunit